MFKIAVLAALLAIAYASHPTHYAQRHGEAHVNYVNGLRQARVNYLAEHAGAGTGTAEKYGVPGTYVGNGYDGPHYAGFHHHPGYGYAGHGFAGHGYAFGHGYADNAARQHYVNRQAQAVGAGIGTAETDGVPGTYLDGRHHGYPL